MDRSAGHLPISVKDRVSSLMWIKVVAAGNAGVGKTCIIKHFCEDKFAPGYQPTVGVDYGFKIQNVSNIDLRVHLWDLSGHPDYQEVRSELYTDTQACFLVFDVTNRHSFENLELWLRELARYSNTQCHTVMVANKVDIRGKRAVSSDEAMRWAAGKKLRYYETSAMTGDGIMKMFCEILQAVMYKPSYTDIPR
ncbi:dnaJ homolog subfamily C member 27-like [Diadema setosum]|uniref:dnaJ homolog subfamily C member 27-like n=1 Tax=Diadema setosum TaxID=31175 RepID=UPI003B3AA039